MNCLTFIDQIIDQSSLNDIAPVSNVNASVYLGENGFNYVKSVRNQIGSGVWFSIHAGMGCSWFYTYRESFERMFVYADEMGQYGTNVLPAVARFIKDHKGIVVNTDVLI